MQLTPELAAKMAVWRAKAIAGTLSKEEMRDAVKTTRQGRVAAQAASDTAKKAKAKKVVPSAADLLADLDEGGE